MEGDMKLLDAADIGRIEDAKMDCDEMGCDNMHSNNQFKMDCDEMGCNKMYYEHQCVAGCKSSNNDTLCSKHECNRIVLNKNVENSVRLRNVTIGNKNGNKNANRKGISEEFIKKCMSGSLPTINVGNVHKYKPLLNNILWQLCAINAPAANVKFTILAYISMYLQTQKPIKNVNKEKCI